MKSQISNLKSEIPAWNPDGAIVTAEGFAGDAPMLEGGPALAGKSVTLSQFASAWLAGNEGSLGGGSLGGPSDPYRQSTWFHVCVARKAGNAARVPIVVSRGEAAGTRQAWGARHVRAGMPGRRKLTDAAAIAKSVCRAAAGEIVEFGELYDLLQRPNPEQRWNDFLEATLTLLDIYGRVHWLFDEMVGRRPVTMYAVAGNTTEPIVDKGGRIEQLAGWKFKDPRGQPYMVTLEECLTFQVFDPANRFAGLAPRVPARLAIIADYNAAHYNAAMFANSCEPGTVLKTEAPYNPELDQQMRTSWQQRHAGAANARKLAILWGGLEHQSVAQTLTEMVYPDGRKLNAIEICAVLNVPPEIAGVKGAMGDSDTYVDRMIRMFWQDSIAPLLDRFGDAINDGIASRFDGNLEVWFDIEQVPIYQQMRRSQTETAARYWGMGVPMEDLNDWLDLGLPDRDWHATGFLPSTVLPVELVMSPSVLPPLDEGEPPPPEDGPAEDLGFGNSDLGFGGSAAEQSAIRNPQSAMERDVADRLWRLWERSWAPLAKRTAAVLRSYLAAAERVLLRDLKRLQATDQQQASDLRPQTTDLRLQEEATGASASPEVCGLRPVVKLSPGDVATILVRVFDDPAELARFQARLAPLIRDGWELGVRQAMREAGLSPEQIAERMQAVLARPTVAQALADGATRLSGQVQGRARQMLRRTLLEGVGENETVNELADRVQGVMQNGRADALRVARNSVGQATSQARRTGAAAAGLNRKHWLSSRGPGERRPEHLAAERAYREGIPIGQPFIVGGEALQHPRDPSGSPGNVINCQCVCIYSRATTRSSGVHGLHRLHGLQEGEDRHRDAEDRAEKLSIGITEIARRLLAEGFEMYLPRRRAEEPLEENTDG